MRLRHVLVGAAATLLLAACTDNPGFPAFDREPTAADTAPSELELFDMDDYDVTTLRYAGEFDGAELYLIKLDSMAPCLLVADGDDSVIACGATGAVATTTPSGAQFELAPAPIAVAEGWTIISENVRVYTGD